MSDGLWTSRIIHPFHAGRDDCSWPCLCLPGAECFETEASSSSQIEKEAEDDTDVLLIISGP